MPDYLLQLLVVTAGSLVQGSVGFGFALVSAPLLVLIDPSLVPGPATVASAAVGALNVYRNRGPTDWGGIRWASIGLVPGTVLAGFVLARVSAQSLAVLVGGLVLTAVLASLAGVHVGRSPRVLMTAGAVSGFMGTTATIGGPPIALVFQRESGPFIRSTLARFFIVASAMAIVALIAAGRLGIPEAVSGVALYPGILLGFWLSKHLLPFLDAGLMRIAILSVSGVSSIAVLVKELL
ncbi:MAG: sulfite exporter TauE/SafE family protein [Actinomycetota bacterium]